MLEELDLADVTVIGNSFGEWPAAEIALCESPRVSGLVITDGIGTEVDDHPLTDVSGLTHAEILAHSFQVHLATGHVAHFITELAQHSTADARALVQLIELPLP